MKLCSSGMHLVAQSTLSNQSTPHSKCASLAAQHFRKVLGSPAMALDASSSSFVFMIPGVMGANAPLPPGTASQPKRELL